MKRLSILVVMFSLLFSSSFAGNVIVHKFNPKIPKIKGQMIITKPYKGSYFTAGNTVRIRWKAVGYIKNKCVSLSLYRQNHYVFKLTRKVCVNGFDWKIPTNFTAGQYKIKLVSEDGTITAYSSLFPIISSKPDLSVKRNDISITPKNPYMGDKVTLNVRITNIGAAKAARSDAKITIKTPYGKTLKYDSLYIAPMSGLGGRYTIKLPLTLDKSRHGKYIVNVHLDYRKSLNEANWNNNKATFSFIAKPLPDLGVCIDANKRPRPFKKTTIRAYVINLGDAPSKPCNLVIAVQDDIYTTMHKYNFRIPAIMPHKIYSKAHVRYRWHDFSNKKKYFYAVIDSKKEVKEVSESNFASAYYYLTRPGGKHGEKNKVVCSWLSQYPVDKSVVGIK